MLSLQVALIDADHRLFVYQRADNQLWDMPSVAINPNSTPLDSLVRMLKDSWGVTTFAKAFFPLTFALDEDDQNATLLYGCRNWVGPGGLQMIKHDQLTVQWVRSVRLGDYPLSETCRMMMPVIMQLMEQT